MDVYDFDQSIGYWLAVAHQAFNRALNDSLTPYGITYRQSHVLAWLKIEGDLCQAELAQKMLIEPPTLVRILDRMEGCGLIQRTEAEGDRRKKVIRLLPTAEPVWDQIADAARRVRAKACEGLSEEETQQLLQMLRRVQSNLVAQVPAGATAEIGLSE